MTNAKAMTGNRALERERAPAPLPRLVLRNVLLADDGSKAAGAARRLAVELAATCGARLTLVYVRVPVEEPATARLKLADAEAAAAAAGVSCDAVIERPVGVTNVGRRIVSAASRVGADVIVIGARGAGPLRKLLGSVSSYVVTNAKTSIWVVR